jgi:hypothetical protein
MKKSIFLLTFILLSSISVIAQDDLMDELNEETKNETSFELPAFKAMKIGNLQSTKVGAKGDLYLYVSHRFGALKDGFDTFFGLDNANTKIQLAYSFWEGVQFSISRESYNKAVASSLKFILAKQSSKFPVNLTGYGTININTQLEKANFPNLKPSDRYSYAAQLLISRRFSENFSFEIAPSYVRQNLQNLNIVPKANHNQFAMGFGGRLKMSKRVSLNAEYIFNSSRPNNSPFSDAYAFGVDIETGGHIFQLLFTNAQSTNEPSFISAAEGDLFFGFNIVRVF